MLLLIPIRPTSHDVFEFNHNSSTQLVPNLIVNYLVVGIEYIVKLIEKEKEKEKQEDPMTV